MIKIISIVSLLLMLVVGCDGDFEVRLSPNSGAIIAVRDSVLVSYSSPEKFDSVIVTIDKAKYKLSAGVIQKYCKFDTRHGSIAYSTTFYKGKKEQTISRIFTNKPKPPLEKKLEVVNSLSRSGNPHTQGYVIDNGVLYESSGEYGKSYIHKVNLLNMKSEKRVNLEDKYFGEGCAIIGDDLYVLTWQEKTLFKFNKNTLELKDTIPISTDGWGLTTDGTYLYLSDGTQFIYTLSATDYKILNKVAVVTDNGSLYNVNELEWIDGYIYANIFMYEHIAKINPKTGAVETLYNASEIWVPTQDIYDQNVLNGIAYDSETKKIYVTGKKWNTVYEVIL